MDLEMEYPISRRAESVAQSLPSISTRYKGVPRRYEETRPVIIQGYAHNRILGIGQELQRRSLAAAQQEKQKAIREAEKAVWAQADHLQEQAIQRAKEEASVEQERLIKKLAKTHEKALKEEALRVEMAMQKLAIEQVKQARAEGEIKLKEALKALEEKSKKDLISAVERARQEEKTTAEREYERINRMHEDKFEVEVKRAALDKKEALAKLEKLKDEERMKAVQEATEREKNLGEKKTEMIVAEFEKRLDNVRKEIKKREDVIEEKEKMILALEEEQKKIEYALEHIQVAFQDFIDRIKCFEEYKGQADYLLDCIYADELSKIVPARLLKLRKK